MRITTRGRVTIPKQLRDRFGLHKNVNVEFIDDGDCVRMVKTESYAERLDRLRGIVTLDPDQTVDDYIEGIRGR